MQRKSNTSSLIFFVALAISAIGTTLFLRYLWSLSLGNGDELFFSTGAGKFEISKGTWTQWGDFVFWIWREHSGRTVDWISAAVYLFGKTAGRWIISILTTLCAAVITWCLMRLFTFYVSPYPKKITWVAPISLLTLLFSYSATNLQSLVNLTMYSAAMCNYFVPSALIFVVLTLVLTTEKILCLYGAAVIGFIAATMHEQSAAILAVLCLLLLIIGPRRWHIIHRSAAVLIVVAGIIEMFMAPGLQNKLSRVAAASPETPVSLPRRLVTTFYGFSVYFPVTAIMISAILVIYLIYYIRSSLHPYWGIILVVSLLFTTLLWSLCRILLFLDSPASSQALTGLSCMLMMILWIVIPLLSSEKSIRFGSVIFLCAASSMAIPAAAGFGAVRVFNFPVIFFMVFEIWVMYLLVGNAANQYEVPSSPRRCSPRQWVLPVTCTLISLWVMGWSLITFRANYQPGLTDLRKQEALCSDMICSAVDPPIPYPQAISGYGEHEYANTKAVLEWIEK